MEIEGKPEFTANRLFGAAICKVKDQPLTTAVTANGTNVQLNSAASRKSIFRRITSADGQVESEDIGGGGPVQRVRRHVQRFDPVSGGDKWKHDLFKEMGPVIPGAEVFVRNLPRGVSQAQLQKLFSRVGDVVNIKIDKGPISTAKIGFLKKSSGFDAVDTLHGHKIGGNTIKVALIETNYSSQPKVECDDELNGVTMSSSRSQFVTHDVPRESIFSKIRTVSI
eukprot:GHVL01020674.1.p1 GENE.GHVL01020674.1~~GHVL01020674.1.p1  ORF type:complete len:224 (-),score=30.48 GHVL01020674.1:77-748(-)